MLYRDKAAPALSLHSLHTKKSPTDYGLTQILLLKNICEYL